MNGKKLVYWDSGIFIAWLTDEAREASEIYGIEEQVEAFENGSLFICTSTLALTEVLLDQLPINVRESFENLERQKNFEFVTVTKEIAKLAQEIRSYYSKSRGMSGTLGIADAIHIATAINQKCEVFYTFDRKERPGKNLPLLPLSGTIAGKHFLHIETPGPSPEYQFRMTI